MSKLLNKNIVYAFIIVAQFVDDIWLFYLLFQIFYYQNIFSFETTSTFSSYNDHDHVIDIILNKKFLYKFLYNIFNKKLKILKNYFDENLAFDKIKHFIVDVDSFILFVFKNNDNLKLCVDYKNLNIVFFKNKHSLSFIDETLNRLINVAYFIKLNLKNTYYRIRIRENNEWKTTFRIKYDLFEYAIIFFDLINASTIFQIFINKILSELINQICVVYLNDIFIYFKTKKKYWRNVCIVLKRLRKYNFYVKLTKCKFIIISIKFLNYIIFDHDISINSNKIFAIKK